MASGWSREEVSMLIDLYRERDILYNVKMPMYHNKHARTDAFEEIVRNMQEVRPNTTVNDVKTKINSLRTQFNKEIGKLRGKPSGSGAEIVKVNMWCFEQLLFLQDQSVARASCTNLPVQQGCSSWAERIEVASENLNNTLTPEINGSADDEDGVSTPTSGDIPIPSLYEKRKGVPLRNIPPQKRKAESDATLPVFQQIGNAIEKITNEQDDQWGVFGKFVAEETKNIKNEKNSKTVQTKNHYDTFRIPRGRRFRLVMFKV